MKNIYFKGPAGSGKTEKLIQSILKRISLEDNTHNILVMTNSLGNSLRISSEIEKNIKVGYRQLWIDNIYGICKRILRQEWENVNLRPNFGTISDFEKKIILRYILEKTELGYFEESKKYPAFVDEVINFLDFLKINQVNVSTDYLKNVLSGPKFEDLFLIYQKYQDILKKHNLIDFRDLPLYVIELFERREDIFAEYKDRFKYVFVDEIEDFGPAEYKVFSFFSFQAKELIVSGNPDESIFGFWGACGVVNEKNLLEKFSPQVVSLPAPISSDATVALFNTRNEEFIFIARKILYKIQTEKCKWKDFAILSRGWTDDLHLLEDVFQNFKIPYVLVGGVGFFKQNEILNLLSILKTIWKVGQQDFEDIDLIRTLTSNFLPWVEEEEIFPYALQSQREGEPLFNILKENKLEWFDQFEKFINGLKESAAELSLKKFIYKVFYEFGFLKAAVNDEKLACNLQYFYQIVNRFALRLNQLTGEEINFKEFMLHLEELLAGFGKEIEITFAQQEDAVKVMTIHQAKGSFFEYVFLIDLIEDVFPRLFRQPLLLSGINTDNLNLVPNYELEQHLEQEERLFSIAKSRAKKRIYYLTYQQTSFKNKAVCSSFLWQLVDKEVSSGFPSLDDFKRKNIEFINLPQIISPNQEEYIVDEYDLENFRVRSNKQKVSISKDNYPLKIPPDFIFSATKISNFQKCPALFFYQNILDIWTPDTIYLVFGSIVHKILEKFHQKYRFTKDLKENKQKSKQDLEKIIQDTWRDYQEELKQFSNFEKNNFYLVAKNRLNEYLEFEMENDLEIVSTEESFRFNFQQWIFRGKIDRVEKDKEGNYGIIDYKTGDKDTVSRDISKNFQLPIYYWACEKEMYSPSYLGYYFLKELKNKNEHRKIYSKQDLEKKLPDASKNLIKIIEKIFTGTFPATPTNNSCWGCYFRSICDFDKD